MQIDVVNCKIDCLRKAEHFFVLRFLPAQYSGGVQTFGVANTYMLTIFHCPYSMGQLFNTISIISIPFNELPKFQERLKSPRINLHRKCSGAVRNLHTVHLHTPSSWWRMMPLSRQRKCITHLFCFANSYWCTTLNAHWIMNTVKNANRLGHNANRWMERADNADITHRIIVGQQKTFLEPRKLVNAHIVLQKHFIIIILTEKMNVLHHLMHLLLLLLDVLAINSIQ